MNIKLSPTTPTATLRIAMLGILVIGCQANSAVAESFSPMNMVNPNRWFNTNSNNNDYYLPLQGPYAEAPYTGQAYKPGSQLPQATNPAHHTTSATQSQPAPVDQRLHRLEERVRQLETELARIQIPQTATPGHNTGQYNSSTEQPTYTVPAYQVPEMPIQQHTWRPD